MAAFAGARRVVFEGRPAVAVTWAKGEYDRRKIRKAPITERDEMLFYSLIGKHLYMTRKTRHYIDDYRRTVLRLVRDRGFVDRAIDVSEIAGAAGDFETAGAWDVGFARCMKTGRDCAFHAFPAGVAERWISLEMRVGAEAAE
jgi:hypothetical protein